MKQLAKIIIFLCCLSNSLQAQPKDYAERIKIYQKAYVANHEVVLNKARKKFRFFKPDEVYKINAAFIKLQDTTGFIMKTSGTKDKKFFRYGKVSFRLNGADVTLTVYQNEQLMQDTAYANSLFLPFTDLTSGEESYGGGRYLDLEISSLKNDFMVIDFNKAYNPYCVYAGGYNCPIPPRENNLPIAIRAGEKKYAGKYID